MPTYKTAADVIEAQFGTAWTFTPIAFENVSPVDENLAERPALSEGTDPYIAIKIMWNDSPAVEVGANPTQRVWGNLAVDFFSKKDTGTVTNQTNLDNLSDIFEYKTISDVVFREITVLRPITDQGWYISPVMLRFYFYR